MMLLLILLVLTNSAVFDVSEADITNFDLHIFFSAIKLNGEIDSHRRRRPCPVEAVALA